MLKELEFVLFWIVIILLIAVALMQNLFSKKVQRVIVFLFIVLFSLMYSYRTLGLDLRNYEAYYREVSIEDLSNSLFSLRAFSDEYEPLFVAFVLIGKMLGLGFNQWLFLAVFFPSLIFYNCILKSKYPLLCYVLFMQIMMFQVDLTRLYIALPFVLLAFHSQSKIRKVTLYAIGGGFHYTTLFVPLCELLTKIKWSRKGKIVCVVTFAGLILGLKCTDLSSLQSSSFRLLFKLQYYLSGTDANEGRTGVLELLFNVINLYPTLLCWYLSYKMQRSSHFEDARTAKLVKAMKLSALLCTMLAFAFSSKQVVFRIQILTYFMACFPLADMLAPYIGGGKIKFEAIGICFSLFLYNILMSLYYVAIGIAY